MNEIILCLKLSQNITVERYKWNKIGYVLKIVDWCGGSYLYSQHLLGGLGRWITFGQEFKTSLANMVKPHLY